MHEQPLPGTGRCGHDDPAVVQVENPVVATGSVVARKWEVDQLSS